jgi:hypothetical protein
LILSSSWLAPQSLDEESGTGYLIAMNRHSWDAEVSQLVKEQRQALADMDARRTVAAIRVAEERSPFLINPVVRSPQGQLTQRSLERILQALGERVRKLNELGSRPSAPFERLTSVFSRSRKDPVSTLRNDIESFSTQLHREASEKGLDIARASEKAGLNRFPQFARDLNKLVQRVSQRQEAGGKSVEAIREELSQQQNLEEQLAPFLAPSEFTLSSRPSELEFAKARNTIDSLGKELSSELAKPQERPRRTLAQIRAELLLRTKKESNAVSPGIRRG